jgi:hypothetical protein
MKFKNPFRWIAVLTLVVPSIILAWANHWILRLIAILMLSIAVPIIALCVAFNLKKPLARPAPAKYQHIARHLDIVGRVFLAVIGISVIIWMTIPYIGAVLRLAANGGKLEHVVGVVEDISAVGISGPFVQHIRIKEHDKSNENITLLFPIGAKRHKRGTRQEFFLLPGTRYALDVRPAETNSVGP